MLTCLVLSVWPQDRELARYSFEEDMSNVRELRAAFGVVLLSEELNDATLERVDRWLNGDEEAFSIARPINGFPPFDGWENSYKCRVLDGPNGKELHFYSMGRDGASLTQGNDEDDIASWRESLDFYLNVVDQKHRNAFVARVVTTGAASAACVTFLMLGVRRKLRTGNRDDESGGTHD